MHRLSFAHTYQLYLNTHTRTPLNPPDNIYITTRRKLCYFSKPHPSRKEFAISTGLRYWVLEIFLSLSNPKHSLRPPTILYTFSQACFSSSYSLSLCCFLSLLYGANHLFLLLQVLLRLRNPYNIF